MIGLRRLALLAVLASIYAVSPAHPGKTRQDYRSPDGKLIATFIDVNKAHESRLEIRSSAGKLLLVQDHSSIDMEHGQVVCKAAWTPDAEFFVFSMSNIGGHSPLGRPTSFYSRKQDRIYSLDQAIGYITDCDFRVQAPNWIITKRLERTDEDGSQPVRVALSTLVK
jgi:hypothetical protein